MNSDYRIFLSGSQSDNCHLKEILSDIPLQIVNGNSDLQSEAKEQCFYTLLQETLSSDCVAINAQEGLSIVDGALLMLAKLYKIPAYVYPVIDSPDNRYLSFYDGLCTRSFPSEDDLAFYLKEIYENKKFPIVHEKINPEDALLRMDAFDAGYDMGYSETEGFWGMRPAHYVQLAAEWLKERETVTCIDLGCGTGKNAVYLNNCGFNVEAIDASYFAIIQAKALSSKVLWKTRDVRKWCANGKMYDLVVMTGLLHCYSTKEEIEETVKSVKEATNPDGYNIISVFNDQEQDLTGHAPDFVPILLPHEFYMDLYKGWKIIASSNTVQEDEHPNNHIRHKHSITRILAQKK